MWNLIVVLYLTLGTLVTKSQIQVPYVSHLTIIPDRNCGIHPNKSHMGNATAVLNVYMSLNDLEILKVILSYFDLYLYTCIAKISLCITTQAVLQFLLPPPPTPPNPSVSAI